MSLQVQSIRMAMDVEYPTTLVDVNTNRPPAFWAGTDVQFQVGVFSKGIIGVLDNITTASAQILDVSSGASTVVLAATTINPIVASADWNSGASAHIIFNLANAQNQFPPTDADTQQYWVQFIGQTSGGITILFGGSTINVLSVGWQM